MEYINKKGEKKDLKIVYGGLFAVKAKSKKAYETFNKYYKALMKLGVASNTNASANIDSTLDEMDAMDAADIIYVAYICSGYRDDYKTFCETEINDDLIYNAEQAISLIFGDAEKNFNSAELSKKRRGKANRR